MLLTQPLHEGWTFHHPDTERDYPAQVPGCIHTDLARNALIPDPFWGSNELGLQWIEEREWDYQLRFRSDEGLLQHQHLELVCEGLDTLATLTLNGQEIGRTENMFVGYRFDVKPHLRAGDNVLRVHFESPMPYIRARQTLHRGDEWNDPTGGSSNIRKEPCAFGWDWGPRFVGCGIFLPIRIEAWNTNRVVTIRVAQKHEAGRVWLHLQPELADTSLNATYRVRLQYGGETIVETGALEFEVSAPRLWWPHGLGEQPLYELSVELLEEGATLDVWQRRVGLRTVQLDRHPDEGGETFQFVVNGLPIFAKGANWIPAHAFVTEVTRQNYADLLQSATEAHMNMLRVWGGGIYERPEFYDLCDEMGLLVWQDFMFACGTYPGDTPFLDLVRQEAEHQVRRLQSHACLALWCGNNEIETGFRHIILATPASTRAYQAVFEEILPRAVAQFDGTCDYWPSSPHHPSGLHETKPDFHNGGDAHYWEVWHARAPIKDFEKTAFRFCSEFGMQSYSSPEVAAQFCDPAQMNVFAPAMENHQKNAGGNQRIFDYISRQYRFPSDYASLAYLSQVNQAHAMKVGVEHFRRNMPHTMGALYWQFNDCWPVFSWSSLEFDGRWKALHFEAKRFFAPALLSIHVPGEETAGIGNYLRSTIHEVNLYTAYDGREAQPAIIHWELRHLHGQVLERGSKGVQLSYGEARCQQKLDFASAMKEHGAPHLYVRAWLEINGEVVSRQTAFLTAPRFVELPRAAIETHIAERGKGEMTIIFSSPVFQTQVQFHLAQTRYRARDNFFDLYPHEPYAVLVRLPDSLTPEAVTQRLTTMSLVDSYHVPTAALARLRQDVARFEEGVSPAQLSNHNGQHHDGS